MQVKKGVNGYFFCRNGSRRCDNEIGLPLPKTVVTIFWFLILTVAAPSIRERNTTASLYEVMTCIAITNPLGE